MIARRKSRNQRIAISHLFTILASLLGALAGHTSAFAEVISAQDEVNTQVDSVGDRFDISGGQLSSDGDNLFQSFEQFDLSAEQRANFIVPSQVNNIFGRIVSGQASIINGQIQTSGGNQPGLYLINPAGILIGPDALLNLSGGFTATTATGIEFADGLFAASDRTHREDSDAKLNGNPTAFEFGSTQAGAVANLGRLEVSDQQVIALVGGTVLNVGTLSAPAGQVTLAAIEGEGLIRISQDAQALSFEIDVQELSDAGNITPATIGEMLTGSSFDQSDSDATTLVVNPDGTVQLGSEPQTIVETGGWAIASGALSTEGSSGGQISVIGDQVRLSGIDTVMVEEDLTEENSIEEDVQNNDLQVDGSQNDNSQDDNLESEDFLEGNLQEGIVDVVSIEATNGITLDNLLDNKLAFKRETNATFRANANNGAGQFEMPFEADLSAPSGTIDIYGAGITAGRIRTGEIILSASGDISVAAAVATGSSGLPTAESTQSDKDIRIVSSSGSVSILEALDTSGTEIGNDILIEAQTDISIGGVIDTSGGARSGNVTLSSSDGRIATAGIITATGNDATDESGQINLVSLGSIEVEFIDARGSSSAATNIIIDTQDSVVVTGVVPNSEASITTAGAENGSIQITYGSEDRSLYDFSIARQSNVENNSRSIRSGITYESIDLESITLTNRGIRNSTDELKIPQFATVETEEEETFSLLETSLGTEFSQYLQPTATGMQPAITSINKVQRTLEKVESTTGTAPALLYVYFVPDAAAEQPVSSSTERLVQPDDQLEVMLITQSGRPIRQRLWGITRSQVEAAGHILRRQINNPLSKRSQYLDPAQQLYSWIVQPIVQELEKQQIGSLGFVLDTGLRTLPLAALHSGDRYLIEDYSIGLLPTFSLTDFEYSSIGNRSFSQTNVLAMGASKFEQQPDLPAVDVELTLIADKLWQGESFINEAFVIENLAEQVQSKQYGVVHLATHAAFNSGDLENSYIQMWNERLSLADIDRLKLSDAEIDLIVLSACNTALGDAGSEYGFAGFAVKTGSQSALASLWPVSDEGTLGFMSQFYSQLRNAPVKAEALRAAQIKLLNGEVGIEDGYVYGPDASPITFLPSLEMSGRWDFSHPFYWSAFTMIGNPW